MVHVSTFMDTVLPKPAEHKSFGKLHNTTKFSVGYIRNANKQETNATNCTCRVLTTSAKIVFPLNQNILANWQFMWVHVNFTCMSFYMLSNDAVKGTKFSLVQKRWITLKT